MNNTPNSTTTGDSDNINNNAKSTGILIQQLRWLAMAPVVSGGSGHCDAGWCHCHPTLATVATDPVPCVGAGGEISGPVS